MFAEKTLIIRICKIQNRALQVVYNEYNKSYEELPQLNNNMSIHQKHLQYFALEVFKSLMHLNPEFMWYYFNENPILYDLIKGTNVFLPPVKSFRLGLDSIHFRGSILWKNLPSSIKSNQTINKFKAKWKSLGNIQCTCVACRWDVFFQIFGFQIFNFFCYVNFASIYLFIVKFQFYSFYWYPVDASSHCARDILSFTFSLCVK